MMHINYFVKKFDQLAYMHVFSVCKECYLGIVTKKFHGAYTCSHCILEIKGNQFFIENNVDPGIQPPVLAVLMQVEEMLISRPTPILQVTHAHGGQYKYSSHTICFPQDIYNIATSLPHLISELDILLVHKCNSTNNPYELFVSRTCVLAALQYKMANNPYYKDVKFNPIALDSLPLISIDISPMILHVNTNATLSHQQSLSSTVKPPNSFEPYELESSSFISTQTNARTEVE